MEKTTTTELLKKVRKLEIRTKALSHQIFAGEYHSAFKGKGMAFSEVREYQWGDDVRSMDWNVTARMHAPYVKVFEEERELTVMLLVDISRSGLFGTTVRTKRDLTAEIAAVLAFSAIINNDKVGALLFSDKVEKFIPPAKGRSHLLHILREVLEWQPQSDGTNVSEACQSSAFTIRVSAPCPPSAWCMQRMRKPERRPSSTPAAERPAGSMRHGGHRPGSRQTILCAAAA